MRAGVLVEKKIQERVADLNPEITQNLKRVLDAVNQGIRVVDARASKPSLKGEKPPVGVRWIEEGISRYLTQ